MSTTTTTNITRSSNEKRAQRLLRAANLVVSKAKLAILNKSSQSSRPDSTSHHRHPFTSTHFDILPVELQVNIFRHCDYHDLLNLRQTSHAFKDLIDINESNIIREMVGLWEYNELSKLFPPPAASDQAGAVYSLRYMHFLKSSHTLCNDLAYHIAERAINPTSETFLRREKKEPASTAIRTLQSSLTPKLYYAYHFCHFTHFRLESARADLALKYTSHLLLAEPGTLLKTYLDIQRELITNLPNDVLITTHHCLTFLINILRISISPEPPHKQNDTLVCSLIRSHKALNHLLDYFLADSATTRNGGRNLRKGFMEKVQRQKEEGELRTMKFGGQDYQPQIKETWFVVAKEEMQKRGLAGHQPELYNFKGLPSVRLGCQLCLDG